MNRATSRTTIEVKVIYENDCLYKRQTSEGCLVQKFVTKVFFRVALAMLITALPVWLPKTLQHFGVEAYAPKAK
jgi:hypothetical protein